MLLWGSCAEAEAAHLGQPCWTAPLTCPLSPLQPPLLLLLQADFIVAGRLAAKIDKVAGVVETNRCGCVLAWWAGCEWLHLPANPWCPGVTPQFCRLASLCHPFCAQTHTHATRTQDRTQQTAQTCTRPPICRPDAKNALYQATIKQGDLLLNRLQKLSKVIDIE